MDFSLAIPLTSSVSITNSGVSVLMFRIFPITESAVIFEGNPKWNGIMVKIRLRALLPPFLAISWPLQFINAAHLKWNTLLIQRGLIRCKLLSKRTFSRAQRGTTCRWNVFFTCGHVRNGLKSREGALWSIRLCIYFITVFYLWHLNWLPTLMIPNTTTNSN